VVEERDPDGFATLDEVVSHSELEAIVKGYSKMANLEKYTEVGHNHSASMLYMWWISWRISCHVLIKYYRKVS
jgi:hypothetical protein